jgi:hypothetical protein
LHLSLLHKAVRRTPSSWSGCYLKLIGYVELGVVHRPDGTHIFSNIFWRQTLEDNWPCTYG